MEFFTQLADFFRPLWGLWLMLLFGAIIAWVMWPTKKRRKDMEEHARIPFRDEGIGGRTELCRHMSKKTRFRVTKPPVMNGMASKS